MDLSITPSLQDTNPAIYYYYKVNISFSVNVIFELGSHFSFLNYPFSGKIPKLPLLST